MVCGPGWGTLTSTGRFTIATFAGCTLGTGIGMWSRSYSLTSCTTCCTEIGGGPFPVQTWSTTCQGVVAGAVCRRHTSSWMPVLPLSAQYCVAAVQLMAPPGMAWGQAGVTAYW